MGVREFNNKKTWSNYLYNTIYTTMNSGEFIKKIQKSITDRLVTVFTTFLVTVVTSGVGWVLLAGGTFYNLPFTVQALETKLDKYEALLEEQARLNQQQRTMNEVQLQTNVQIKDALNEIKTDIRELRNGR